MPVILGMFPRDEETAALQREATALKKAGDFNAAIDKLYAAQKRMLVSPIDYSIDTWCRLGVFLQLGGRFDEAVRELLWLAENVHATRPNSVPSKGTFTRQWVLVVSWNVIYDKLRLVCKREKKLDEAARYQRLRDIQRDVMFEIEPMVQQEWLDDLEESKKPKSNTIQQACSENRSIVFNP